MEVLSKEWKGYRTCLSGNTSVGQEKYSRSIQTAIRKIEKNPGYARKMFDSLALYTDDGIFKGDIQE